MKYLDRTHSFFLALLALLVPVVIFPIFPNAIITPKIILISVLSLLAVLIFLIKTLLERRLVLQVHRYDLPVFLLLTSTMLSTILRTPNKMEALFLPGMASVLIFGCIIYFMANHLEEKGKKITLMALYFSGLIVSLSYLLTFSRVFNGISQFPAFLKDNTITLAGSNMTTIALLAILIPLGLGFALTAKEVVKQVFYYATVSIISLGLILNIITVLPGKASSPKSLSNAATWAISIDTLKESPILGAGVGNFLTAFNRFRSVNYNQTADWQLRYTTGSNFFLTVLTEMGLLGLFALSVLTIKFVQKLIKDFAGRRDIQMEEIFANPTVPALAVAFIALVFTNISVVLAVAFFLLLSLSTQSRRVIFNLKTESDENTNKLVTFVPTAVLTIPLIAAVVYFMLVGSRVVSAEYTYYKAIEAINKNDGTSAYNLLRSAITKNSTVDRYHQTLMQINFGIAENVAASKDKESITEEDRNLITQLIQQAIEEGKASVSLNPTRAASWSLLANLYQSIMAFAQGSDQFAVQSYNQAIALDPTDPTLRIGLGGVYFALGNYDASIDAFKTAVMAKPDLANARYNLAVAYREKGSIELAIAEMTTVLSLVEKDSKDYELAKQELTALEAKRPAKKDAAAEGETLETPEKAQNPVVEPPIELPEDAEPPTVEPTPLPSLSPSPVSSASPSPVTQ